MSVRGARTSLRLVPMLLVGISSLLTLSWVAAALMMSGRGFDLTDEGFYVLSYRWWHSTPRTVTGVQYLYGPVFQLLGFSIQGLRLVRLLSVLLAHAAFAWAFVSWWIVRRPHAFPSREWRWAAGLSIVATGGITYGWLPLSPAYNDVAALASLAMLAAILRAVRAVEATGRLPVLPAVALGPLALALVMAKWASAGVTLAFLVAVAAAAVGSARPAGVARFGGVAVASLAVSAGLMNWVVGGYASAVPPLVEVNRLVAQDTNSPVHLLDMYARTSLALVGRSILVVVPALLVVLVAVILSRRGLTAAARAAVILAPAVGLLTIGADRLGFPVGGTDHVAEYSACLMGMSALVALAVVAGRWRREGNGSVARISMADASILLALLGLPLVQALGTGNPLYYLAIDQFATWVALFVVAVTTTVDKSRLLAGAAAVCAVVVAAEVGISGLLVHPYRTSPYADATTAIGGSGPLASVRVSPTEARRLTEIRHVVGDTPSGRPMMAFDELAGLVLLLDGRSVGEAWYSALDRPRTVAGIEDACRHGGPWKGQRPVLFFNRPPQPSDASALATCNLDLTKDFRVVRDAALGDGLSVYMPQDRGSSP